jgi:cell division protein FtsA
VLGIGQQRSRGLKAGVVVDLDAAEQAVRAAVVEAERLAGVTLENVLIAVACGRLKSSTFVAHARIEEPVVSDADIDRLQAAGRSFAERDGRTLVHMNCIAYRLDESPGIADPRGMAGTALGADMHVVTADEAPLDNLVHAIERAYLSVAGAVPAPYASGLAASQEEEREQGVACVDIGAGATTLSMFYAGHLLAVDGIPVGGDHVTSDLARASSLPLGEAERIKMLCGKVGRPASDDHDVIAHALASEGGSAPWQTTKGRVREVVSGRMSSLLGQVAERIERSGSARHVVRGMILTGGASQLPGLAEFAAKTFGCSVRVAQIEPLAGMPSTFRSPAFSTVVGLAHATLDPNAGVRWNPGGVAGGSYLRRMGQWLRASF